MSASRIFFLGEGERDVGRVDSTATPGSPCDFEGDLPRLVRRVSEIHGGLTRFGYDAETLHDINARIPERAGQAPVPEGKDVSLHADDQRRAAWENLRPEVVAQAYPRGFAPFERALAGALSWL